MELSIFLLFLVIIILVFRWVKADQPKQLKSRYDQETQIIKLNTPHNQYPWFQELSVNRYYEWEQVPPNQYNLDSHRYQLTPPFYNKRRCCHRRTRAEIDDHVARSLDNRPNPNSSNSSNSSNKYSKRADKKSEKTKNKTERNKIKTKQDRRTSRHSI